MSVRNSKQIFLANTINEGSLSQVSSFFWKPGKAGMSFSELVSEDINKQFSVTSQRRNLCLGLTTPHLWFSQCSYIISLLGVLGTSNWVTEALSTLIRFRLKTHLFLSILAFLSRTLSRFLCRFRILVY